MRIEKLVGKVVAIAIALDMCSAIVHGAAISVATVGTYAASPTAGMAINDATSNSAANGVTLPNFQTMITAAFAAQTGGVINGEDQSAGGTIPGFWRNNNTSYGDGVANQITATYGSTQLNSLGIYRTDIDPANTLPVGINGNTNNAFFASGNSYIGVQGPASPVNLAFTKGLSALGFTGVPRGAARDITMTAVLSSGSVIGSTHRVTDATTGAYFWGFQAPSGNPIVGLTITSFDTVTPPTAQFSRFDDLGFIVAIPEPATVALLSLASFGVLAARRRSKKN